MSTAEIESEKFTGKIVGKEKEVKAKTKVVCLIVGLGRFGTSVAKTLDSMGEDVLCVDTSQKLVQYWSAFFPCVQADMTDPAAMEEVGTSDFNTAIVAIGTNVEASILTTGNLLDAGIDDVWAKATTNEHARILERIGTHHIVNPEADAGERVGHLVSGKLLDYIRVDDDFTIVKMTPPREVQGFKLRESKIRSKFGVTILGTKTPGEPIESATQDTRILPGDIIIVGGSPEQIERFASK
ncbi:MAG: TrkA family potassium uptake protein [Candidatus Ancillula sp.]|jgi:trk system potassium uptake protein TrkA|nr:TrkA family potassium uptake protein [Candidatus Ancillula sp.]